MMYDAIARLLARRPFVPFDVVMSSGDRYPARNEDMAVVEADVLTLYHPKSDRYDLVWMFQVVAVELLDPQD